MGAGRRTDGYGEVFTMTVSLWSRPEMKMLFSYRHNFFEMARSSKGSLSHLPYNVPKLLYVQESCEQGKMLPPNKESRQYT